MQYDIGFKFYKGRDQGEVFLYESPDRYHVWFRSLRTKSIMTASKIAFYIDRQKLFDIE